MKTKDENAMSDDSILNGPLTIEAEMVVRETIAGDTVILANGRLVLHGTASGNVTIESGGEAFLYGTVTGTVINRGKAHISGIVLNGIDRANGAVTTVAESAKVSGGTRET